jgi:hypothetical protein
LITLALPLLALIVIILFMARGGDFRPLFITSPTIPSLTIQVSPPSGSYDHDINVKLSSSHTNGQIYFTTDGLIPSPAGGTLYTKPLHLPANPPRTAVIRAQLILPDGQSGPVASATYFMGLESNLPLVSLIVDPDALWNAESGIFANPYFSGREWEREAEILFYEPQSGSGFQAPIGLRVHGAGSRVYEKKSLRLYFRAAYGQPDVSYPLFPDSDKSIFKRLVLHDGGQDIPAESLNATLLRNHLVGNLAREAGSFATHSRPVLLFLNGELWGIYNLRERIDGRYLRDNFQIEDADLLSGLEHNLDVSAGDRTHWNHLMEYVAANDLTGAENYTYIQTQMNLDNFITYALIQIITANIDWPQNNQTKFRGRDSGRWHWMFWDSDYAFGLMTNSNIEKDMFAHILDQEDEHRQQSALLLLKLLQNSQFKTLFLATLADLLNTVFAPDHVLAEIDQLATAVEEDIPYETRRWPGPGNWEAGVDYMREFARRRPDIVRRQAVEAFDLPGTRSVTINQPTEGHGTVSINGGSPLKAEELPWQGEYFQGVAMQLAALPEPGYQFVGWDPPTLPQTAVLTLPNSDDLSVTPRFTKDDTAGFRPGDVKLLGYGRDTDPAPMDDIQGAWVALQVRRPARVDLRGWRISDNDSLTATDEGSLILGDHDALANVPAGTTLLLVATKSPTNDRTFAEDDLSLLDGRLILYAGNDILDIDTDPWFDIGDRDNLVLLAPGTTAIVEDDLAIDFLIVGEGNTGTAPADFGLSESPGEEADDS